MTRAMVRDSPSPGPRAAASPGTRRRTPRAKSIKRLLASNLSPFQVTNDQWEHAIWSRDHMLTCDWLSGAAEGDRVLHEADHREVRPDQVSQGGDRDMVLLIININFAKIVISGLCKTILTILLAKTMYSLYHVLSKNSYFYILQNYI